MRENSFRYVYAEIGRVRIGEVYWKCVDRVQDIERWIDGIQEVVGSCQSGLDYFIQTSTSTSILSGNYRGSSMG